MSLLYKKKLFQSNISKILPNTFDTIDTPSLIRKILTLSQHSTYASMLALYIEDKTKFRKQDVSSPNSVVQLVQKKRKKKKKTSFLFVDIKFFTRYAPQIPRIVWMCSLFLSMKVTITIL